MSICTLTVASRVFFVEFIKKQGDMEERTTHWRGKGSGDYQHASRVRLAKYPTKQ